MLDTVLKTSADTVKISVDAPETIKEKLSEAFVLEMTRQLTAEISRAMSLSGLPQSNVELKLVFSPETFMEHSSENVTYRRLLITDKACGDKDFWVKWTRNNGAVAYSMSDSPAPEDITFELGEDVPQKIREKEYRYLVRTDTDKYHYAMGRKNITEWRELIKRAIKRGDLTKIVSSLETKEPDSFVSDKLSSILSSFGVGTSAPNTASEPEAESPALEQALRKAQEVLDQQYSETEAEETAESCFVPLPDDDAPPFDFSPIESADPEQDIAPEEPNAVIDFSEDNEPEKVADPFQNEQIPSDNCVCAETVECECVDWVKSDCMNEALSAENIALKAENERLRDDVAMLKLDLTDAKAKCAALEERNLALVKEFNTLRERISLLERERDTEKQRLREEIDARVKAENRELARLEEAARLAVDAQRRADEEQAERDRLAEQAEREANGGETNAEKEAREQRELEEAAEQHEREMMAMRLHHRALRMRTEQELESLIF